MYLPFPLALCNQGFLEHQVQSLFLIQGCLLNSAETLIWLVELQTWDVELASVWFILRFWNEKHTYQWHTGGWEILWKHFTHINGTWNEKKSAYGYNPRSQGPPYCVPHSHGVMALWETAGIRWSGVWTPICHLIYLPVTGIVLEENQKMTNCFWF